MFVVKDLLCDGAVTLKRVLVAQGSNKSVWPVPFRVLTMSETAFLAVLTKTVLLEGAVTTPGLKNLIKKREQPNAVEKRSFVTIAANVLVRDDIKRVGR